MGAHKNHHLPPRRSTLHQVQQPEVGHPRPPRHILPLGLRHGRNRARYPRGDGGRRDEMERKSTPWDHVQGRAVFPEQGDAVKNQTKTLYTCGTTMAWDTDHSNSHAIEFYMSPEDVLDDNECV